MLDLRMSACGLWLESCYADMTKHACWLVMNCDHPWHTWDRGSAALRRTASAPLSVVHVHVRWTIIEFLGAASKYKCKC